MPLVLRNIEPFVFRAPLAVSRRNAFGVQHSRALFLVRVTDRDGAQGFGEGFCNWPAFAAEYRASYVRELIAPLLEGHTFDHPTRAFEAMNDGLARLRDQSADHGAVNQAIAAVDGALWDLFARRQGVPLWRCFGADAPAPVTVYASALTGATLDRFLPAALSRGVEHFKLKVGFSADSDASALRDLSRAVGAGARLMVDANQTWTVDDARERIRSLLAIAPLEWVEEPIRVTEPPAAWALLRAQSGVRIAAGENLYGPQSLAPYLDTHAFDVVQPDIIKWGGLTGTRDVMTRVRATGAEPTPHYLGGGVGLAATAHLIAATGGGLLEFDVSENPFRDALGNPAERIVAGEYRLPEGPGIGFVPDLNALANEWGQ